MACQSCLILEGIPYHRLEGSAGSLSIVDCLDSCFCSDFVWIIIRPPLEARQQAQLDAAGSSTHPVARTRRGRALPVTVLLASASERLTE